jgi:hypothetical protein
MNDSKTHIGETYGDWTVVAEALPQQFKSGKKPTVICACKCGESRRVQVNNLLSGGSTGCGCSAREAQTIHGGYKSYLYRIWIDIKSRCLNPRNKFYHRYGARGIQIQESWAYNFGAFEGYVHEVLGVRPEGTSIDRRDNNEGYCEGNLRWATPKEQNNNLERNRHVTHRGETLTVSQWSRKTGIHKATLQYRLNRGWAGDKLFSPPKH